MKCEVGEEMSTSAGQKGRGSQVCHGITVTDSLHHPAVKR